MSKYSTASFEAASVQLKFAPVNAEAMDLEINVGDELQNLMLDDGTTYETATFKGFTVKPRDVRRGKVTIYDAVPMFLADPNGGQYRGFVQEELEVKELRLTIDGEDRLIPVEKINTVSKAD